MTEKHKRFSAGEYDAIRTCIRRVWRKSAWLHLRMTNDIDTRTRSLLTKAELDKRLREIEEEIAAVRAAYFVEQISMLPEPGQEEM